MKKFNWLGRPKRELTFDTSRQPPASAVPSRRCVFEELEDRRLLAADFGDAPDTALGTGVGNYHTLTSDNGPSHTIVAGLRLGASVDGHDGGVLQNALANADDIDGALPDDEDGLVHPSSLTLTIGAEPKVHLWVTNTTGTAATLYGWIDYNGDGVFDNNTERAEVGVPDGTTSGIATLAFSEVSAGSAGTTYARFRLSTDPAAADPTGAAVDGEVEDYRVTIYEANGATFDSSRSQVIGDELGGGPPLWEGDFFGTDIASLGDMDGDGIADMVVGNPENGRGGLRRGFIFVLFMHADGTVKSYQEIGSGTPNAPTLLKGNQFGTSVAALGDLDGDGVTEIAVGARGYEDYVGGISVVHVLFMNSDGTVKSHQTIGNGFGGGPSSSYGSFGSSIASLGDFDGDGVGDMIVGANTEWNGGIDSGAVYILLLNSDGTVKSSQKISHEIGGGPTLVDNIYFGEAVASLGDLNGDSVTDIVVGTRGRGGIYNGITGSVYVLLMNPDGTVLSSQQISSGVGGGPDLVNGSHFGSSIAAPGDLDGDGVVDLAVSGSGYSYFLMLNPDGTVRELSVLQSGMPTDILTTGYGFGIEMVGDLDGDGLQEVAVQSRRRDRDEGNRDAIEILFLQHPNNFAPQFTLPTSVSVPEKSTSITTVTVSDEDVPAQPMTMSIVGGADKQYFTLASDGQLSFKQPRDHETPVDADRDNVYLVTIEVSDAHAGTVAVTFEVTVTNVEDPPSIDYGDAPDPVSGTGPGNYATRAADFGPSHAIVAGLRMGMYADGDNGELQNVAANADDSDLAIPDDEDGLFNPTADLTLTLGTSPTVNVWVTNTTGAEATLSGWIDYNGDGFFNSEKERAFVAVPDGTSSEIVTLAFPEVRSAYTGETYARFRLSTDVAAASPTGAASDGEVEDYRATIVAPSSGQVDSAKTVLITHETGGGPSLITGDRFGRGVAAIGDLDGDGIVDLAVGADQYFRGEEASGSVYVLFMNSDGTVKNSQQITVASRPPYVEGTFGTSVASLGDLDGDGVTDIVVGDSGDSLNGEFGGAVYIVFLNTDGTAKQIERITQVSSPLIDSNNGDQFGHSVAAIGDLDGDGVTEIAVGSPGADSGTHSGAGGALDILFLNTDGSLKTFQRIPSDSGGGPVLFDEAYFGMGVAGIGDFDGDGVGDIVVGAGGDGYDGPYGGAVYLLLLNPNGTVKSSQRLAGPPLNKHDWFGSTVASLGDVDGNGVVDIAVGASYEHAGGPDRGAIYILFLNADGTVQSRLKIADNVNGGPELPDGGRFGRGIASLGDLDGDGIVDIAVGSSGGYYRGVGDPYGSVQVLFLESVTPDYGDAPDTGPGTSVGNYQTRGDDNGPSHTIVTGLHLGGTVDGDSGTAENLNATADNSHGFLPSDEDGLVNPLADLRMTVGTTPSVNLWVTNTTDSAAMLYGWIDYNADGVFDNTLERASIAVAPGSGSSIATLVFPTIPNGSSGTSYARFRLSTDPAAADPFGPALGGEVEDYRVSITALSSGTVDPTKTKILARNLNGILDEEVDLSRAVASVGDLDGDGVPDLVSGAGYTLFMNADGTVKHAQSLSENEELGEIWGYEVAAIGDLDGDGVSEIAVSGYTYETLYKRNSFFNIVYLNIDGTAKGIRNISEFSVDSIGGLGDLDSDGVPDLAYSYANDGLEFVNLLRLNPDGTVKDSQTIASGIGGGPLLDEDGEGFGSAIASLGDLDGDGISDLAISAIGDKTGSADRDAYIGAVYIMFMNADGTARSFQKIGNNIGGGPSLEEDSGFGFSLAALGDLDGDGNTELAVGAYTDGSLESGRGAVHVLFLNADGSAKATHMIADGLNGGPLLEDWEAFGWSMSPLGDLDGDGITELAVGASDDDESLYILFLDQTPLPGDFDRSGAVTGLDFLAWQQGTNKASPDHADGDANGDGVVDGEDLSTWTDSYGFTYSPPPITESSADFDADGDVDGLDFLTWQTGFGTFSGATHSEGDADNDGAVDSGDLATWELTYGQTENNTFVAAISSGLGSESNSQFALTNSQPVTSELPVTDLVDAALAIEWMEYSTSELSTVEEEEMYFEALFSGDEQLDWPIPSAKSRSEGGSEKLGSQLINPVDQLWLADELLEQVFGLAEDYQQKVAV